MVTVTVQRSGDARKLFCIRFITRFIL